MLSEFFVSIPELSNEAVTLLPLTYTSRVDLDGILASDAYYSLGIFSRETVMSCTVPEFAMGSWLLNSYGLLSIYSQQHQRCVGYVGAMWSEAHGEHMLWAIVDCERGQSICIAAAEAYSCWFLNRFRQHSLGVVLVGAGLLPAFTSISLSLRSDLDEIKGARFYQVALASV
ncbi:hypothetical protein [Aquipseudomonas alcaligenes]|uniref:hypothetical protein n=1 Tax=Aquipseudomonas alcaligenes TaxID=43263 RepID=UPI0011B3906E|nr:hypothetical protein [Pseudomonas alcaligenes]